MPKQGQRKQTAVQSALTPTQEVVSTQAAEQGPCEGAPHIQEQPVRGWLKTPGKLALAMIFFVVIIAVMIANLKDGWNIENRFFNQRPLTPWEQLKQRFGL